MEQSTRRATTRPTLRAGGQALTLLAGPLNVEILRLLEQEPRPLQELRSELGLPPQSTMRLYLRTLSGFGVVERRGRSEFPTASDYEITDAGRALLDVGDAIQAWLDLAPSGPKKLGGTGAKSSIKTLVEGWSSHIIRILASRPLSLTELNSLIPRISYPSLERRLTAMRECDLVEAQHDAGRVRPYRVTDWLRQAVLPLTAAITWERTFTAAMTARIGRLDVEAIFLLAIPLLDLPPEVSGKCRLAVEVYDGTAPVFAGVLVGVEEGNVTSCVASVEGAAAAWASGKPLAWMRQMGSVAEPQLDIGGDRNLAHALVEGLRRTTSAPR